LLFIASAAAAEKRRYRQGKNGPFP